MRLMSLILGLSLLTTTANAAPSPAHAEAFLKSACSNVSVQDANAVYLGFGPYRKEVAGPRAKVPSSFVIRPLDLSRPEIRLHTLDTAWDMLLDGETLYVLTPTALEEWHTRTRERMGVYSTYDLGHEITAYKEHATGFARVGDELVISHGRLGVSIFDMKTKRLVFQEQLLQSQLPLESQIVDVAVHDGLAILAVDNFSLVKEGAPPFRGLILFDVKSRKVLREIPGLDPAATTVDVLGDDVFVGFDGPIWKLDMNELKSARSLKARKLIWKYGIEGHPIGKLNIDGDSITTCFLEYGAKPGVRGKKIPKIFSREEIKL